MARATVLADCVILFEHAPIDAEELRLRILGVGDEPAFEAAAGASDISQQGRQHSAGATLGGGNGEISVAEAVHQPLGLLVQMVRESRLESLTHPRSPLVG